MRAWRRAPLAALAAAQANLLAIALAMTLAMTLACGAAFADDHSHFVELARSHPIIDTHIDVPYRLVDDWEDVSVATERGDFDFPRAREGGLSAPFMSIYIPASLEQTGRAAPMAHRLIDSMEALAGRAPDKFALAYRSDDVLEQFERGLISLALGMENGSAIEGKLDNVRRFYDRGIRYISLAHSRANHLADSSYDINRRWKGISPFGREVIAEMNRLGIVIDLSHISDQAAFQVLEMTRAPVIASHSSVRKFTPGWERNISDELIQAMAKGGGVVQINFGSTFVSPRAWSYQQKLDADRLAFMEEIGTSDRSHPEVAAFTARYKADAPFPYATLDDVLNNFDHVVNLVGVDHVGIGSDYDGVGDSLPENLKDVSTYPNLLAGLSKRGYSDADLKKIMFENTLRVWRAVEAVAKASPAQ